MTLTVRLPIADPLYINARNAASQSGRMMPIIRSAATHIVRIALTARDIMPRIGRIIRMAKNFENGVSFYTEGKIELSVFFPEDDVRCKRCQYCRAEESLGRFWCRLTNKMIYNPNYDGLPDGCPITIKKEE